MAVRDNLTKYNRYLPIAGGELNGNLGTQNIYPNTEGAYNLGMNNKAFGIVYANRFNMNKNNKNYANIVVGAEGTTANLGYAYLNIGNDIPKGTNGNAWGYIGLFGQGKGNTFIVPKNNSDNSVNVYLPELGGKLMRKEDYTIDDEGYLCINLD